MVALLIKYLSPCGHVGKSFHSSAKHPLEACYFEELYIFTCLTEPRASSWLHLNDSESFLRVMRLALIPTPCPTMFALVVHSGSGLDGSSLIARCDYTSQLAGTASCLRHHRPRILISSTSHASCLVSRSQNIKIGLRLSRAHFHVDSYLRANNM